MVSISESADNPSQNLNWTEVVIANISIGHKSWLKRVDFSIKLKVIVCREQTLTAD